MSTQRHKVNSLIDDIRDEQNYIWALESKVSEYDDAIDFMNNQFEDREEEFANIPSCIDDFYHTEMTKLSPLFIKRHMVDNKNYKYKGLLSLLLSS